MSGESRRPRGILLQEAFRLCCKRQQKEPESSGIKQRLTYGPDTDRQRSLGIRGSAPCRFVSYPWSVHHQSSDCGYKDLSGCFCSRS